MGYNTSVIVLNDAIHHIKDDPEFGKKLYDAVLMVSRGKPVDISSGGHVNAATVIESHHADCTTVLAVGGNSVSVLGTHWGWKHHETEEQLKILRSIANEHGFNLVRKRKSRNSDT